MWRENFASLNFDSTQNSEEPHIPTSAKLYAALLLFLGAYFAPAQENVLPSASPTEVEVRGQGWWSMNQEQLALARARHHEQMQSFFGLTNASRYFDAIDQSYLQSGFLKAHPEIKYAYGPVIALGYNFYEEPRRQRQTGKYYGASFAGSEMLRTDTNGFIIEVQLSKPIKDGTLIQAAFLPEQMGLSLKREREWKLQNGKEKSGPRGFQCGTVLPDRDVAIRVYIRYNEYTDRKLLEEAFAPIAAAFANEKQQPPP